MTHRLLTLCATSLIALIGTGSAIAQTPADATPPQTANPQESTQKVEIGNETGNVKTGNIVQNQSGKGGNQSISIGNTKGKGNTANVTIGNIVQNQKEGDKSGSQTVEIGQGTHGDIIQNGGGIKKIEVGIP
jgi:hypothetical protein